jgi:protein CpxP
MKKNTILYILLVFLVLFNGFFLFNFLGEISADKGKETKDPMGFVKQQLNLNATQIETFEIINKEHHQKMMGFNDDLRALKDTLFNNISENSLEEESIDSIATLIGEKQKVKEIEIYDHFKSIQELCDAKQKEKFKKILKDAIRRGDGNRPPPPNRQRGPEGADGHRPPPPNDF